jgi:hypothetical protein
LAELYVRKSVAKNPRSGGLQTADLLKVGGLETAAPWIAMFSRTFFERKF